MAATLPDPRALGEILRAGILAPSADNRHELRFVATPSDVRLTTTERTAWAESPHRRFLGLLAFGAVIENIRLASGARGWALQPLEQATVGGSDQIAALRWRPDPTAKPDPLASVIETRHTNRRFYRRQPIAPASLARLQAEAAARPGGALAWLDTPALRRAALNTIRLAETERFRRRALHAELFGAVRFDVGWHGGIDLGLPPAALEVELPTRPPFALMRNWRWMRLGQLLGAHHAFGLRAGWLPCALAPQLGLVFGGAGNDDATLLDAGAAFQRVWLAAAAEGLAMQPMAASTVLVRQPPGGEGVSPATQRMLMKRLTELRGTQPGVPVMLFRLGHAAPPSAVTGRMPLEHYLG